MTINGESVDNVMLIIALILQQVVYKVRHAVVHVGLMMAALG